MTEDRCGMEALTMEREHVETEVVDSRCGPKMTISVCNAAVPAYWTSVVLKASEIFIQVHAEVYGKPPESIYVDGKLMACLDRRVPAAQKLSLHIVIVAEKGGGSEPQDYMVDIPILPDDGHYAEARQCFMDEFEAMLGGRHGLKD